MRKATFAILLTLFVSTTAAVRAEDAPKGDKQPGDKAGDKAAPAPAAPRKFVTHHRFTAGGVDIPYTATAEDIDLKDRDGKPTARFSTISYTAEGVKRQEDRPITFFFNGGPGSSSVFLHLGFVGPKRIDIPSEPHTIRSAGDIRKCHGNTTCRADRYRELTVGLTTRSR